MKKKFKNFLKQLGDSPKKKRNISANARGICDAPGGQYSGRKAFRISRVGRCRSVCPQGRRAASTTRACPRALCKIATPRTLVRAERFCTTLRNKRCGRRDFGAERRNTERPFRLFRVMRCRERSEREHNRNYFRSVMPKRKRAKRAISA